jgi:hypothetical protein
MMTWEFRLSGSRLSPFSHAALDDIAKVDPDPEGHPVLFRKVFLYESALHLAVSLQGVKGPRFILLHSSAVPFGPRAQDRGELPFLLFSGQRESPSSFHIHHLPVELSRFSLGQAGAETGNLPL